MSPSLVGAADETATFLEAGSETIVAVATQPVEDPLGIGVIFLPGGGAPLTTGRNRFAVRLCRSLAAAGFHTLRLDYHGAGESTGSIRRLSLDRPFVDDTRAAIRFLRLQGVDRFILVGSCFGARTALAAAAPDPEVIAVALISCPVRDFEMGQYHSVLAAERRSVWTYVAKGLHPRSLARVTKREWRTKYRRHARAKLRTMFRRTRAPVPAASGNGGATGVSSRYLAEIRTLVDRSAPILLIYGSDEYLYDDFRQARRGQLGQLLATDPVVTETVLDGSVHGFTSVDLQDAVLDVVVDWVGRTARGAERDEPGRDRRHAVPRSGEQIGESDRVNR